MSFSRTQFGGEPPLGAYMPDDSTCVDVEVDSGILVVSRVRNIRAESAEVELPGKDGK